MTDNFEQTGTRGFESVNTMVSDESAGFSKNGSSASPVDNVLDRVALETLRKLADGEWTLFTNMIDKFLAETPPLLIQLRDSLERVDPTGLQLAAHTIKAGARDFGATHLVDLCQTLENIGESDTIRGATELVIRAEAEYEQVRTALLAVRNP
jgi:HPt (histidine-containing phosphotransfer) domain-containing protein